MKFSKKILFLFSVLFIVLGVVACQPSETPVETPVPTVEPTPEPTPEPSIEVPDGSVLIEFASAADVTLEHVIIESGSLLNRPEAPIVSGLIFVEYYTDETLTTRFDFSEPVTASTTVYLRYAEDTYESMVALDVEFLSELDGTVITGDRFTLPTIGQFTSRLTWSSSNSTILTRRGWVIPPNLFDGPQEVTLSVTVLKVTVSEVLNITVTVLPYTPLDTVSSQEDLPFNNLTSEYEVLDGTLTTYFLNESNIPYVDVKDFLLLLEGVIESSELEFVQTDQLLTISYTVEYTEEDEFGVEQPFTEEYSLVIDFENGTITAETLSFFGGYIKSTATDYSEGLTYLDTYTEDGQPVVFDLGRYNIDILLHEETETKFLLPFHLVNTLFIGTSYYNVYYNGDGFYGVYGVPSNAASASDENKIAYTTINNSSFNNTVIPHDIAVQTLHMTAFVMDYFYGLKNERGIKSFYDVLEPYADDLVSNSTRRTSESLFTFLNKAVDDLHTSHRFPGFYEPASFTIPLTSTAQLGTRVNDWYYELFAVQDALEAAFPTNPDNTPPNYRFIDNNKTAVLYLDGFYTATVEDPDGDDSNRYMRETLDAIFAEQPGVENIVVDLSYNTGGNLGALLRVLGYLTEQPIEMHYQNPTEGSKVSYFVEVETVAYEDINWFILTSRVTFSAANLMTSIAKQQGFATILGTTSGGGASSITPIILPNGTFFTMSSLNVLSYRTGNDVDGWEYFSIELGVEPDYIVEIEDLYNDVALADIINQALSEQTE
ncbi:MAG: S41 family peptidase [Acholeplasmataceae bacterium]